MVWQNNLDIDAKAGQYIPPFSIFHRQEIHLKNNKASDDKYWYDKSRNKKPHTSL